MGALKNHLIDRNNVLRNMAGLPSEIGTAPDPAAPVNAQPLTHAMKD
jgi:hypothetical protein